MRVGDKQVPGTYKIIIGIVILLVITSQWSSVQWCKEKKVVNYLCEGDGGTWMIFL